MVPIPTNPELRVVITVPPVPTVILSPAVKSPSVNVNLSSVSKSPLFLNNTELLLPGGAIVISAATPVVVTTVPIPVGVFPIETLFCKSSPVLLKVPDTLVSVTIPELTVGNFTTPDAVFPDCVTNKF